MRLPWHSGKILQHCRPGEEDDFVLDRETQFTSETIANIKTQITNVLNKIPQ
jgi:hypothetical protein